MSEAEVTSELVGVGSDDEGSPRTDRFRSERSGLPETQTGSLPDPIEPPAQQLDDVGPVETSPTVQPTGAQPRKPSGSNRG